MQLPLTEEDYIDRERYRRSGGLYLFTKEVAWPAVEAAQYIDNWHIGAICEFLEALHAGQIRFGVITVPPRFMKSLLVSVSFPAWVWTKDPAFKMITSSYAEPLALRDAGKSLDVIRSTRYQQLYGAKWQLKSDAVKKYTNTALGERFSTGVGGAATGEGGDLIATDDPIKAMDGDSEAARAAAATWWSETMASRLNDPKTGRKLVTMQRLHQVDVAGFALARGNYEHLNIPMRWYDGCSKLTSLPSRDPRTKDGQLAWPSRFDEASTKMLESELGSYATAGQLQQTPSPRGGGRFKRKDWKYYQDDPAWLAANCDALVESWDCAFKDNKNNDFVAGVVLAQRGPRYYFIDVVNAHLGFAATQQAVKNMHALHGRSPRRLATLIEDKANGTAVIETLRSAVPGVVACDPEGGKQARASILEPLLESGCLWLPDPHEHPHTAQWVETLVAQFENFPNAAHDDIVDATSQAAVWLRTRKGYTAPSAKPVTAGARTFAGY